MEFFTALIIYYSLDTNNVGYMDQDLYTIIWFEKEKDCQAALMVDAFFETIYEDVRDTHVTCQKSQTLSQSIKPRLRP